MLIFFIQSTHILRYAGKFSGVRHSKIRMLEKKSKSCLFWQKYTISTLFKNQVNDLKIILYSDEETASFIGVFSLDNDGYKSDALSHQLDR